MKITDNGTYLSKVCVSYNYKDIQFVQQLGINEICYTYQSKPSVISPHIVIKNLIFDVDSAITIQFKTNRLSKFSNMDYYYYSEFDTYALKTIDTQHIDIPYVYIFVKFINK